MFWFVFSSKTATNLFLIIKYTAGNYPKVSLIWCVATNAALTAVKNVKKVFGCPTHSRSFHNVTLKTPGFVSTNMSQLPIQKKNLVFAVTQGRTSICWSISSNCGREHDMTGFVEMSVWYILAYFMYKCDM